MICLCQLPADYYSAQSEHKQIRLLAAPFATMVEPNKQHNSYRLCCTFYFTKMLKMTYQAMSKWLQYFRITLQFVKCKAVKPLQCCSCSFFFRKTACVTVC